MLATVELITSVPALDHPLHPSLFCPFWKPAAMGLASTKASEATKRARDLICILKDDKRKCFDA